MLNALPMLNALRLTAALLACLALPALAQTPAPQPTRPAAPMRPTSPAVPSPAAPTAVLPAVPAARTAASGSRIDINTATEQQLDSMPGIGPARAKAIIAGRPYTDLKDLVSKKILSQGVLDGAKDRMALANINTSSAGELQKTLTGIGDVRARAIVAGRPYAAPEDLVKKGILTQGVFNGMKDMIAY